MAYETVSGGAKKDYAPTKYVRYTTPEDRELTEKDLVLKKDQSIEGYYLRSYVRVTPHGEKNNHVLVTDEGTHLVIPDNKDVTKAFLSGRIISGAKTRFTYLGKNSFEYKKDDGSKGTAKAVKALIEQDKDNMVAFEGEEGCEKIAGSTPATPVQENKQASVTAQEIPF